MRAPEYDTAAVTSHDYYGMTVSEKIRHHRILAGELRRKAGPMFRMSEQRHMTAEEMPREWHELIAQAKDNEASAERLQRTIRGAYGSNPDDSDDVLAWARNFAAGRKRDK